MAEELNIDGHDATPATTQATAPKDKSINNIHVQTSHLENIVAPGTGDIEFIDALIGAGSSIIPWGQCQLPSRGLYYGWDNDGIIPVRGMGQAAEKAMAIARQGGQAVDNLFKTCTSFPPNFTSQELLLGDRNFLLYYIRGVTFGQNYEFAMECSNCGATSPHIYDLNKLVTSIKWANPSLGSEPFRVNLPFISEATQRDVWVSVRFMRGYDSDAVQKTAATKKKMMQSKGVAKSAAERKDAQSKAISESINDNLEQIVMNINGVVDDRFKIRQMLSTLQSQDLSAIRDWVKDKSPGIDTTVVTNCPECETETTALLPLSDNFFRRSDI